MKTLVSRLAQEGVLRTKCIKKAFFHVDRKNFILPEHYHVAYDDIPLPIGYGQTISQPTTVAFMLEMLQPQKNETILDVGSGSGWTTALLADIVGPKGKVFGVEIVPELVSFGQNNLSKFNYPQARITGAGKRLGLFEEAPFEKILVSATSQKIPKELIDQLKIGGTMVIPIKTSLYKIQKKSEVEFETEKFSGFAFVPLV